MQLTAEQLERFHRDGFLVIEGLFGRDEANRLRARLPALFSEDTPANIREKSSGGGAHRDGAARARRALCCARPGPAVGRSGGAV